MPTKGTMRRQIRGISDQTWAEFEIACREVNGSADRSADIRAYVERVVAEWHRRRAGQAERVEEA